jgi:hypothetical protein
VVVAEEAVKVVVAGEAVKVVVAGEVVKVVERTVERVLVSERI